jgi:hypothetical protein
VIVELRREPATPVGDVVDMEKSPTWEMKMAEWVRPPPVPVTLTRNTLGVEEDGLQVPVTGPLVTTNAAGQLAARPVEGETVVVRVTVPTKLPIGVIVMVELPVAPRLKSAGEEAVIEKSKVAKVNLAVVEWNAVPGEPVAFIVTENVPGVAEVQDSFEVPVALDVSVTGVVLKGLHVRPAGTVAVNATEPAKFSELVRVTFDVIVKPALPLGDVAETEKSPTWEMNLVV